MELRERIERVEGKAELVEFIRALVEDLALRPNGWENPTLERYLQALAGWLEDSDGYYENTGQAAPVLPSWRTVADMLMAAKMYE